MSKPNSFKRWIAGVLAASVAITNVAIPVSASEADRSVDFWKTDLNVDLKLDLERPETPEEVTIPDDQVVRVSIVLEEESTIDAGYEISTIAIDPVAIAYRDDLKIKQETVETKIERQVLGGDELDVVWNLTLAANLISANVEYGQIDDIKNVPGVKDVVIEMQYEPAEVTAADKPNMGTSSEMIGSNAAWASDYTGAGSLVAIIDTGIDDDHQSFDAGAFEYSLAQQGYTGDLLTEADIAAVLDQLNIYAYGNADASKLNFSSKVPFAYNYVDRNYVINHDNDEQGEHGSHVTGIAAANAYIPNGDGTYSNALTSVKTQGVAPDAQIITMKVFGKGGGAYDSDYMVAIEDAIVLGADSINLSLGSSMAGHGHNDTYQDILDKLAENASVVTMSAGNSGTYAESSYTGFDFNGEYYDAGYTYGDDVKLATGGSPASYTNSLSVASIDNAGFTGEFLQVGEDLVFYTQSYSAGEGIQTFSEFAGQDLDYVFVDAYAAAGDFDGIDVAGKVVIVWRGQENFTEKGNRAAAAGAKAVIIANNAAGTISMVTDGYTGGIPYVSITQADGYLLIDSATGSGTSAKGIDYYTGSLKVGEGIGTTVYDNPYTMSSFSSWGIPETLELKPEITAPGGNIYSVNGLPAGGTAYETMSGTSMAAPQVAGMSAVLAQYIRDNDLTTKTGLTQRQLIHSLLMSTAVPVIEEDSGSYYSVLNQGAGLANVGAATQASSYIQMGKDATASYADGKVKAEVGEVGDEFSYTFTINNFSDEEVTYTLDTDLFTQDIFDYTGNDDLFLDTWTIPLTADVTYDFSGNEAVTDFDTEGFSADVNQDGFTTPADAQALLDYITSGDDTGLDLEAGDVDGDEKITTYDAYLILVGTKTLVSVPAGKSVEVTVNVTLTDSYLNNYENGAYIEGYTFINPLANDEGALDVTYSIPILGFYGNWSEPSMYDTLNNVDYYGYDTSRHPYSYTGYYSNGLYYEDALTGEEHEVIGNPYYIEDTFPYDKVAIRSTDTLAEYDYGLIRNAGTVATVITDANGNILDLTVVAQDQYAAFYYASNQTWQYTGYAAKIGAQVGDLGVKEGDVINVSVVAIPEYYGTHLSAAQVEAVLPKLGDGAYLTTTMTVDDTAPVIPEGGIIDNGDGTITVTVTDNENVAYVALISRSGAILFDDEPVVSGDSYTLDASYVTGHYAAIFVADYAGNEDVYEFEYGDPIDWAGTMFGSTNEWYFDNNDEPINTWVTIDPEVVDYLSGMNGDYAGYELIDATPIDISAAAYADGYIFQLGVDGALHIAPLDDPGYFQYEVAYLDFTAIDMAFNYTDSQIYALDDENGIWKINPLNGKQTFVGEIDALALAVGLAIDSDNNFYAAGYDRSADTYLYTWVGDDIADAEDTNVEFTYFDPAGVLTYDFDNGVLYMAADATVAWGAEYSLDFDNLYVIDVDAGTCEVSSDGLGAQYGFSNLCAKFNSIFVVPSDDGDAFGDTADINITVSTTDLHLLVGGKAKLEAIVSPWTLEDRSVTWSSADTTVATVDANGIVTGVGEGETTITAAAKADPTKTATVNVTVEPVPPVALRGLVYDTDSETYWSKFNTATLPEFEKLSDRSNYFYAGTMNADDTIIYAVDNNGDLYAVDPVTFESELVGGALPFGDAAFTVVGEVAEGLELVVTNGYTVYLVDSAFYGYSQSLASKIDSPIAGITYEGYTVNSSGQYIDIYLLLLENGDIWQFLAFYDLNAGELLGFNYGLLGSTGIAIPGASAGNGTSYASLLKDYYSEDEDYEHLYLAYYVDGDVTAHIAMIDIDMYTGEPVVIAEAIDFGDDVWPVVALYQDGYDIAASANYEAAKLFVDTEVSVDAAEAQSLAEPVSEETDTEAVVDEEIVDEEVVDEEIVDEEPVDEEETGVEAVPVLPVGSLNAVNDSEVSGDEDQVIRDLDELEADLSNALTIGEPVIDKTDNTITIPVVATKVTNALYELAYDSDLLTLSDVDRLTKYDSEERDDGSVLLNFASANAESGKVSELVFTYDEEDEAGLNTVINISVYELGVMDGAGDGRLLVVLSDKDNPILEEEAPIKTPTDSNTTTPGTSSGTPSTSGEVDVNIDLGGHGTTDAPSKAKVGEDLEFTITPAEGYALPNSITVIIGGRVLDPSEYSYDHITGKVVIPGDKITGNISVNVDFVPVSAQGGQPSNGDDAKPGVSTPDVTPDDGNGNGNGNGDQNPGTGVTVIFVPALVSAAAIMITKKRK